MNEGAGDDVGNRHVDKRFVLFLVGFYAVWALRVIVLLPIEAHIDNPSLRFCSSEVLKILIWVLPVFAYIKFVAKGNPLSFLKLNVLPRKKPLLMGAGIVVTFLIVSAVGALLFQSGNLHKLATMTGGAWWSLIWKMALVAFTEETLFRGFIFQKLRAAYSFQRANLLTSVLFLLIHWLGWLFMRGPHWELLALSGSIFIISWVLGLLCEVTQSLWPPVVLHFINNVFSEALK